MSNTMRERMVKTVSDLIEGDQKTALLLADISASDFQNALDTYPERVINLGIMEQALVSVASGYALEGFHPIVHSIAPFVTERPFEQIKDDFCYQGVGGTFISTGASYDYGADGMTHHGPGDVPVLKTLPGMQICVPGAPDEFESLLRQTYNNGDPTYIRTSIQQNGTGRSVDFGKFHLEQEGSNGVVLAVGPMLDRTLAAVKNLNLSVLYATTVVPFDDESLQTAVANASANVILVEPYYEGGMVQDIAKALVETPVRIEAIGVPRRVLDRYGPSELHDKEYGLTVKGIRTRVTDFLKAG